MNTYVFLFLIFPTFRHYYDILKWQSRRAQTTEQELKTTRRFRKDCTCQNPERLWLVRFLYVASSRTVVFAKLAGEICWFIHQKKECPEESSKSSHSRHTSLAIFDKNLDEWYAKNHRKKFLLKEIILIENFYNGRHPVRFFHCCEDFSLFSKWNWPIKSLYIERFLKR